MGNATVRVQDVVDYALTFPEVTAVLPNPGYSYKKVYQIMNKVMQEMLSFTLKWPFNRKEFPALVTNSWQEDYATNLVDVGFLQDGTLLEINNTANPQPIWPLEVTQNLPRISQQFGRPGQVSAYLNKNLSFATWGAVNPGGTLSGPNPQASQVVGNPVGAPVTPANPYLQCIDGNGGLWVLTGLGGYAGKVTLGTFNPFDLAISATSMNGANVLTVTAPNNVKVGNQILLTGTAEVFLNGQIVTVASVIGSAPNQTGFTATGVTHATYSNASDTGKAFYVQTYPTFVLPTTVPSTVADGTGTWTAVNPNGYGFRLSPLPPQTGVPYQAWLVYQMRPPQFGLGGANGPGMSQTIDPVPDDFAGFFQDGFVAHIYPMNPDPKVRAKHADAVLKWKESIKEAKTASDRTRDSAIMFPSTTIMGSGYDSAPNPAYPYGPPF